MYANLTAEQRANVVQAYRGALLAGSSRMHATAVAGRTLVKTDRGWNGVAGSNAWAAALAVLVNEDVVRIDTHVHSRFEGKYGRPALGGS